MNREIQSSPQPEGQRKIEALLHHGYHRPCGCCGWSLWLSDGDVAWFVGSSEVVDQASLHFCY